MSVVSAYSDGKPFISCCLRDPAGKILLGLREDEPVYSASTIKVGVLLAAMEQVAAGRLDLSQPLTATRTFSSRIRGAGTYDFDPEEVDEAMVPGTLMCLDDVLRRMIEVSSNEATNMAAALVGLDTVDAAIGRSGASNSGMGRLFGDYAALAAGFTNVTTASDLTLLMRAAATREGPTGEAMRDYLRGQRHLVIAAELLAVQGTGGMKLDWGSKSGSVTGIEHDVAFFRPNGGGLQDFYTLAVCTRGYAPEHAQEIIRAVTASALLPAGLIASVPAGSGDKP